MWSARCRDPDAQAFMRLQNIFVWLIVIGVVATSYRVYGWAGVTVATGLVVMWLLLHFTRMMQVLRRAANRPIGFVGSAVMFHARLRPGMTLLHVVTMTRSLGELRSVKDIQPEQYRWSDGAQSHVDCKFQDGKLLRWKLVRPREIDSTADATEVSQSS